MDKEEFLGKLQLCYFGDRNAFEEIVGVYDDFQQRIDKTVEKLSFIDMALKNNTLNVPLCITKINKALDILKGSDTNE